MNDDDSDTMKENKLPKVKGLVHPKLKILSLIAFDYERDIAEQCLNNV